MPTQPFLPQNFEFLLELPLPFPLFVPFSAPSLSARLGDAPGPLPRAARAAPARWRRARRAAPPQAARGAARGRGALRQGKGAGRTKGAEGGAGAEPWTRFCSAPLPCCSPSFSSSPAASAARPGRVSHGTERTGRDSLSPPPPRFVPVGAALLSAGGRFAREPPGGATPRAAPEGNPPCLGGERGFWGVPAS